MIVIRIGRIMSKSSSVARLIRSILFIALTVIVLEISYMVLRPSPDDNVSFPLFLKQPKNSIQVLNLGNSHSYYSVIPIKLYEAAGITSFNLGGPSQPIPPRVGYLKDALKTQSPEVVTCETYYIAKEYDAAPTVIANSFNYWPISPAKIETIFQTETLKNTVNLLFPLNFYHSRWSEIRRKDFHLTKKSLVNETNQSAMLKTNIGSGNLGPDTVSAINEKTYMKNLPYFREIAEICHKRDIKVVFWASPRSYTGQSTYLKRLKKDLGYKNVYILNMNDMDGVNRIDVSTDFKDTRHLNVHGSTKTTRFFGDFLTGTLEVKPNTSADTKAYWDKKIPPFEKKYQIALNEYQKNLKTH